VPQLRRLAKRLSYSPCSSRFFTDNKGVQELGGFCVDKHVYQHSPALIWLKILQVVAQLLWMYFRIMTIRQVIYTTVDRNILSKAIDIILKK
jgi:hypothetical protein